jgi:hypothetical protein
MSHRFKTTFGGIRTGGLDRGSRRGAQRMIVTADFQLLDHALAKTHNIAGVYFQSKAEALRWIALNQLLRAGHVRDLERQVRYPLHVVNPEGLKVKVATWTADFVYKEKRPVGPNDAQFFRAEPLGTTGIVVSGYAWFEVIEDVKGHPEDAYLLKRKMFEAEYGKTILESKAWARR